MVALGPTRLISLRNSLICRSATEVLASRTSANAVASSMGSGLTRNRSDTGRANAIISAPTTKRSKNPNRRRVMGYPAWTGRNYAKFSDRSGEGIPRRRVRPCVEAPSFRLSFQCFGSADDFEDLVGDGRLPRLVVRQSEFAEELRGVVGGLVHCGHPRSVFRRIRIENGFVELYFE